LYKQGRIWKGCYGLKPPMEIISQHRKQRNFLLPKFT